jgi:hypothetical protein
MVLASPCDGLRSNRHRNLRSDRTPQASSKRTFIVRRIIESERDPTDFEKHSFLELKRALFPAVW